MLPRPHITDQRFAGASQAPARDFKSWVNETNEAFRRGAMSLSYKTIFWQVAEKLAFIAGKSLPSRHAYHEVHVRHCQARGRQISPDARLRIE
jgi:hypothetical protein